MWMKNIILFYFNFNFFEYRLEDFLTYDQRREIGLSDSCIGFLIRFLLKDKLDK